MTGYSPSNGAKDSLETVPLNRAQLICEENEHTRSRVGLLHHVRKSTHISQSY